MKPYQNELSYAEILGWNEGWVVWRWADHITAAFPEAPYHANPVSNGRIAGSGTYDLTAAEATALTGIPL